MSVALISTVVLTSTVAREQQLDRPRPLRPWQPRGSIDVEVLVHWAYGIQLVDRFERSGLNAIELAAAGFEARGYSGDGVGQLMAINNLGCRIDSGGVSISDAVHPAAYAVALAVRGLDREQGQLVRAHAQAGTRPTHWKPPLHRVRPVMWSRQGTDAVVEYEGPGRKGGHCRLIWVWDAGRERWGRAIYQQWWAGLEALAWELSKLALGFTVTGPAAPLHPWGEPPGHPPSGSSEPTPT